MPLLTAVVAPRTHLIPFVAGAFLVLLALLGAVAARARGANLITGALRVLFWGALAMALTAGVGALVGSPL
jgi:vacuolar iron transporter family protein